MPTNTAFARCASCRRPLPPYRRGRRRQYCSTACRRSGDFRRRRLRLRLEALAAWIAALEEPHGYAVADICAALRANVRDLEAVVRRG